MIMAEMSKADLSKASSLDDLEKKDNASVAIADQATVPEYERFLHLENTMSGQAKKKLIRKRMSILSNESAHCR